jgi:hypothetical protein
MIDVNPCLVNEKYNNNAKSKTITRKDTIDQFNKDFINTVGYNLFQKHECVTIRELKNLLEKRSYKNGFESEDP